MRSKITTGVLLLTLATAGLPVAAAADATEPTTFLVRLHEGMNVPVASSRVDDRWLAMHSNTADPDATAIRLSEMFGTTVVPDRTLELAADPDFDQQWHLENTGQTGGTPDADVDALEALEISRGEGVVVAVIDSGVDLDHPDLVDRIWVNETDPANGLDDDGNGFVDDTTGWDFAADDPDPSDELGHGTGVAGIIAAAENGTGTQGVAPDATIMALRACTTSCSVSNVLGAIQYAVDNGADIINMSLGGPGGGLEPLEEAVAAAGEADVLVVAAAGNSGIDMTNDPYLPAGFDGDHIVSVTATDHNDELASFANTSSTLVDLAAPGASIYTTDIDGWTVENGTSFAAPVVAGVAALIRSHAPGLDAAEVRDHIMDGGDGRSGLGGTSVTGSRANATTPVVEAGTPKVSIDATERSGTSPFTARLTAVTSDAADDVVSTEWEAWDGTTASDATFDVAIDVPGVFEVSVMVRDAIGNVATDSVSLVVGVPFTDTGSSIFEEDIRWLSATGVTRGCTPTTFCGGRTITRGEMAAMLRRAFSLPAGSDAFGDDDKTVFEDDINALAAAGVTAGCAAGSFCPNQELTRAQLASMLVRALGLAPMPGTNTFEDDDGSIHAADIEALASAQILRGCNPPDNDRICPTRPITRQEMAAVLRRAIG